MDPVRIGLIGCGVISNAYLRAADTFHNIKFVACADINSEASQRTQDRYKIPAMSVEDLLKNDEVEVVLNLTIPAAHAELNAAALENGKHTYCEKPFALNCQDGEKVVKLAHASGLSVGCAPDTFLGGGHQTVRRLIDEGVIGTPGSGTAFMMGQGPESWHPSPVFYYKQGGGPLFDMGPYYLTALVNSLGPVKRVAAITGRALSTRKITSKPLDGTIVDVEVDTHTAGVLEFEQGTIVTVVMSFDVWRHSNRFIEIHGTTGSLSAPDPNTFGGVVRSAGPGRDWQEHKLTHGYTDNMRSIGLADMCKGIRLGRPFRANGEIAYHVLEVMEAFGISSEAQEHIEIKSRPERPQPLPSDLKHGELD